MSYKEELEEAFFKYEKYIRQTAHKFAEKALYTEEEDLYQIGCEAFVNRFRFYDPSLGKTPWDYLWIPVASAISNYIKRRDGYIHFPQNPVQFTNTHYEYELIGYPDEYFEEWADVRVDDEFQRVINVATFDYVKKIMDTYLTDRERNVLIYRYGLEDGEYKILEDTAKEFGVTRERVRQIEKRALKKLQYYLTTKSKQEGDND